MKRFSTFTRNQRIGVVFLLLIIVVVQVLYFFVDFSPKRVDIQKAQLIKLNKEVDSLRAIALLPSKDTIYPFNPNFITDYKGFVLGMKPEEIDRLFNFRKQNKFVNSAKEFQQVTKISDSLLTKISPYFTFPDWVNKAKTKENKTTQRQEISRKVVRNCINQATKDDLMNIYGIGDVLSNRILKYREKLQGFTDIQQVSEVYGLEKEVFDRLTQYFEVKEKPVIQKKNLNSISMSELSKVPYLNFDKAKKIVTLRSELVNFKHFEELLQITEFNPEIIEKLKIYLLIE